MKRHLFILLFALGIAVAAMSQSPSSPNEGVRLIHSAGNSYSLSWDGRIGRSYFVQHSEDLVTWTNGTQLRR